MTSNEMMLKSALHYHNEGLCVIPVKPRQKMPALPSWDKYKEKCSTKAEMYAWFGNGHEYNIGIVHGPVSRNYVALDIDHDRGVLADIEQFFPELCAGRIEQSGSGEGYHIPLRLGNLPNFGIFSKTGSPRGNRTWKTPRGDVNIRARACQTVVPPSLHPSGKRYSFLQKGEIAPTPDLISLINWLDTQLPKDTKPKIKTDKQPLRAGNGDTLLDAVLDAWSTPLAVLKELGLAGDIKEESDGELRLLGHGGLMVNLEKGCWHCFADEVGGGPVEAWGWQKFGSCYDSKRHFRQVLLEMAKAGGIDVARFYCRGDEEKVETMPETNQDHWAKQFDGYWSKMRSE